MGTALLVTGAPGVGKTTLVRAVAAACGKRAGGFVTEEIREEGRRVGFRVCSLEGAKAVLAHVRATRGPRVGRYQVDVPAFEAVGVSALEAATRGADLIVVDEIGKMESLSQRFVEALEMALRSPKPILGTVLQAPHPWIDALKRRPEVELYRLTERNKADLQDALLARLTTEAPR
jgi:nucleoside-triphosphatase